MFGFNPFGWMGNMMPYSNLHNQNQDWMIQVLLSDKSDVEKMNLILPELVNESVDKYFEEHPPIPVANNTIDSLKLKKESIPFYNVKDYGIEPDNGDVYRQLHAFFKDVVYNTGGIVYFPKGKYTVSYTIFIPENTTIIGDGAQTEIYFDESDTAFGVALCNAGSNVKICNMKVSQLDTGTFYSGPQSGCIGLGDISKFQCQEAPYSHNFIRESDTCNLTVENVVFSGKYPLQCEPATGTVRNVTYRNIISTGTISAQTSNNAEIDNLVIENCTCDLLRILLGNRTKNIKIRNVLANGFNLYNLSANPVEIMNCANTSTPQTNQYENHGGKNKITGQFNFADCYFTEDSSIIYGIVEATGIHIFDRCIFNFPNKRAWTRLASLAENDNYSVINDCKIVNASEGSTSVICGYGKNNIYEGLVTPWLFGDMHSKKILGGAISSTNLNAITIEGSTVHLRITTPFDSVNAVPLPSGFNMPYDTTQAFNVTLFNATGTAVKHTWACIENNVIVLKEPNIDITPYNRIIFDCDIYMTRDLNPVEVYSLLG